jgi:hypothetical protein
MFFELQIKSEQFTINSILISQMNGSHVFNVFND